MRDNHIIAPDLTAEVSITPASRSISSRHGPQISRGQVWLVLFVVLPSLCAGVYLGWFATPRYQSEALFVVRSQESSNLGGFSALVQSVASSASHENAYVVLAWLQSSDALAALEQKLDYDGIMSAPEIDPLSRYMGPFSQPGREGLLRYYNSMVEATMDTRSGIIELSVTAFTPQDAQNIAKVLIDEAELLVNRLNMREQAAHMAEARAEVERAENSLLEVHLQVQRHRIETGIVDPSLETETGTGTVLSLQQALSAKRAEYQALLSGNPESPLLPQMLREVEAMSQELERTRATLAGETNSLVEKITAFEQLALSKEFAAEALLSARRTLETARLDASRKSLFLAALAQPNLADTSERLRALRLTATIFTALFLLYSILWLLFVNVREHRLE